MENSIQQQFPHGTQNRDQKLAEARDGVMKKLNDTLESLGMKPRETDAEAWGKQWNDAWRTQSKSQFTTEQLDKFSSAVQALKEKGLLKGDHKDGLAGDALAGHALRQPWGADKPVELTRPQRLEIQKGLESLNKMVGKDGVLKADDQARLLAGMENSLLQQFPPGTENRDQKLSEARSAALKEINGAFRKMGVEVPSALDNDVWGEAWKNRSSNPQLSPQDVKNLSSTLDTLKQAGLNPDLSQGLEARKLAKLEKKAPARDLTRPEQFAASLKPVPLTDTERGHVRQAMETLKKLAGEDGVWRPDDRGNNLDQLYSELYRGAHEGIQAEINRRAPVLGNIRFINRNQHAKNHNEAMGIARSVAVGSLNDGQRQLGMPVPDGPVYYRGHTNQPSLSRAELENFGSTMEMIGQKIDDMGLPGGAFEKGLPVGFLKSIHDGAPILALSQYQR
ncbi:MAG: hypothetical protein HY319_24890 [Armatimonadetes bacterium]|nr:hypothetical protein [Armatimonadota bacterium]